MTALIKYAILGLIVVLSSIMGNSIVTEKEKRIRIIRAMKQGIAALKNVLQYQRLTLQDGLRAAAASAGDAGALFVGTAVAMERLPQADVERCLAEALEKAPHISEVLKECECDMLTDVLRRMSHAMVNAQIEDAAAIFGRQTGMLLDGLTKAYTGKARCIRSAFLLGGLAVAIILA